MVEVLLFNGPESMSLKQSLRVMSHFSASLVVPLLIVVGLILMFYAYVSVRSWIALISGHKILMAVSIYFAIMQLNFLASTRFAIDGGVGKRILINTMLSNIYMTALGLLFGFAQPVANQIGNRRKESRSIEVGQTSVNNGNAIETIENDSDI